MSAIKVKDLSFKYNLDSPLLLNNINFEINRGEFVSIIGKNGAGKTTLCNIIRGLIYGDNLNGSVCINDVNINDLTADTLARSVGIVFDNPFVQISGIKKTVQEEVAYGLENLGVPQNEMHYKVAEILKSLKISHLKDSHPSKLSGGQRQRIAIASVLVMDPDILIIDEPTSQLDPEGTNEVFETINYLKNQNKTIILVEHKIDLIAKYASRVLVLDQGKIVADGDASKVLTSLSLLNYQINLPQVSLLAYQIVNELNLELPKIPITVLEAKKLLESLIKKV